MARRKRKIVNQQVKQRRLQSVYMANIVRSEPVIRVFNRVGRYTRIAAEKAAQRRVALRKEFDRINAPRRFARKLRQATIFGALQKIGAEEVYHKVHNCKREWRKLLSWRTGQGAGRKRTQREISNNKLSFIKKDC